MTSRSSHVLLITLVLPDGGTSAKRIRPLVAVGSTVLAILLVSLLIATSAVSLHSQLHRFVHMGFMTAVRER